MFNTIQSARLNEPVSDTHKPNSCYAYLVIQCGRILRMHGFISTLFSNPSLEQLQKVIGWINNGDLEKNQSSKRSSS